MNGYLYLNLSAFICVNLWLNNYKNNNIKDKNLKAELAFLKAVPPFSDLNDHELRFLLENLIKRLKAGE